jgi:hypothetical protein
MVREHCDLHAIEAKRARECDAIVRLASDQLCPWVLRDSCVAERGRAGKFQHAIASAIDEPTI